MALFLWIIVLAIIGFNMSPTSTFVALAIGVFFGVMKHTKSKEQELNATIKAKRERRDYLKYKIDFCKGQISSADACISNLDYQLNQSGKSETSKANISGHIKTEQTVKDVYQKKHDVLKAEYDELVAYLGEHDLQGD